MTELLAYVFDILMKIIEAVGMGGETPSTHEQSVAAAQWLTQHSTAIGVILVIAFLSQFANAKPKKSAPSRRA